MRNLKRVLALALALVMVIGMMVIGSSAASYADEAAIDKGYAVAVEVLSDMGVFKGQETGFAPKATLTRAEAAALIYRVITSDVTDSKIDLYDYASFADVEAGKWYTGYVTYAANGGYIKGYDGNFMPYDQVTGVQVLAILLRAVGYGQNGEFEGAAWKDNVLTAANDAGMLAGVSVKSLDIPASRELVAQLLWNALGTGMVTYTPALGYIGVNLTSLGLTQTLGQKNFGLSAKLSDNDDWGRPMYGWSYTTGEMATWFTYEPVKVYTTAVTDCQIAVDLGLKADKTYTQYVDGYKWVDVNLDVDDIDYMNANSTGTGVLTEIYKVNGAYTMVSINTYFAQVTDVLSELKDIGGHVVRKASIEMTVYSDATGWAGLTYATTGFAEDDYVLVNMLWNGTVKAVAPATYVNGTVATITYNNTPVNGTVTTQVATYGENVKFYVVEDAPLATKTNYNLFMDNYGNVIAALKPSSSSTLAWGVFTAIKWVDTNDLLNTGYTTANIMQMNAQNLNTILLKNNVADVLLSDSGYNAGNKVGATVSSSTQYNTNYTDELTKFVMNPDGTYNIDEYATDWTALTSVKTGVADIVLHEGKYVATNANTEYLVKVMQAGKPVYLSYVGYENVPTMTGLTNVQFFAKNGYVTRVFIDATGATYTGSTEIVYINSMDKTAEANGLYGFDGFIGTAKTTLYSANGSAPAGFTQAGVYKVSYNAEGKVLSVENYFEAGNGIVLAGVDYCNGTVIENVDADDSAYACVGAQFYKITADGTITTGAYTDFNNSNKTAFMVTNNARVITAIYYFG